MAVRSWTGTSWTGAGQVVDEFVGDGVTISFALSKSPVGDVQLAADGINQPKASFSVSGKALTINPAPDLNVAIEATYIT